MKYSIKLSALLIVTVAAALAASSCSTYTEYSAKGKPVKTESKADAGLIKQASDSILTAIQLLTAKKPAVVSPSK